MFVPALGVQGELLRDLVHSHQLTCGGRRRAMVKLEPTLEPLLVFLTSPRGTKCKAVISNTALHNEVPLTSESALDDLLFDDIGQLQTHTVYGYCI